jgi:hypothetical protein
LDDYKSLLLSRGKRANGANGKAEASERDRGGRNKKAQRRAVAEKRKALASLKQRLVQAETMVHRLEAEKSKLLDALADPKLYEGESDNLLELRKRLSQVGKDLGSAEATWVTLQERWDQA